jgi:hypothetical protein
MLSSLQQIAANEILDKKLFASFGKEGKLNLLKIEIYILHF